MFQRNKIKELHIEITDKCNAACPMCPRNIHGGKTNPNLPLKEISLEQFKNFFPIPFLRQLRHIYFAGSYGDPAMAQDTLEIFSFIRSINPNARLGMHTNGGARDYKWWTSLGQILSQPGDYCVFSVDGLENTNSIYRRQTSWKKITTAMETFLAAGGRAYWEYLVFSHNNHQIEQAREMARRMGFQEFIVKYTGRFAIPPQPGTHKKFTTIGWHNAAPVYSNNGDLEYFIQPAAAQKISKEKGKEFFSEKLQFHSSSPPLHQPLPQIEMDEAIECKAEKLQRIFLVSTGHIFPCPWTYYHLYRYQPNGESHQIRELFSIDVLDTLDLNKNTLEQVLLAEIFQSTIPARWEKKNTKQGALATCIRECGGALGKKCSVTQQEHYYLREGGAVDFRLN